MEREVEVGSDSRTQRQPRLAQLASGQHGVVSHWQLLALGFGSSSIKRMVANGRLHRLYRGVYAVGHRVLSRGARFMAACLATGGVISHRSAGVLHQITRYDGPIEVTVPTKGHSRPNLLLHCAVLPPDEITTVDVIPVTTPPRTLLDLASMLPRHRLERAVGETERLNLTDSLSVPDLLARHPGRRGSRALSTLMEDPPAILASELEHLYLTFTAQFGLLSGHTNASREGHEVDVVYSEHGLIVELDGRATHARRLAFEQDREKDRRLAVAGWRVVRITWRQLTREPERIAADLGALLTHVAY